jgi:hypothetical protein
LIEEFANKEKPTDGELYRKIRLYHFQQQPSLEKKWKARLRGNREKNLTGLLRNEDLAAAFDALLEIPGLWDGMRLSQMQKWVALKCDEVGRYTRSKVSVNVLRNRRSYDTLVISNKSGQIWSGETGRRCKKLTRLPSRL